MHVSDFKLYWELWWLKKNKHLSAFLYVNMSGVCRHVLLSLLNSLADLHFMLHVHFSFLFAGIFRKFFPPGIGLDGEVFRALWLRMRNHIIDCNNLINTRSWLNRLQCTCTINSLISGLLASLASCLPCPLACSHGHVRRSRDLPLGDPRLRDRWPGGCR